MTFAIWLQEEQFDLSYIPFQQQDFRLHICSDKKGISLGIKYQDRLSTTLSRKRGVWFLVQVASLLVSFDFRKQYRCVIYHILLQKGRKQITCSELNFGKTAN